MLNIYYGRETTDKEKFIFDNMKGKTLLLVPDQFSLQAERDAFFYLKKEAFMDLRVVDFSTLGHKVVHQMGGKKPALIDKYGSQMLITKALDRVDKEMKVYRGNSSKSSFINHMHDIISDMKQYGIDPKTLETVAEKLDENRYLRYKLEDIHKIFAAYEDLLKGKYLDAEDYILFYGEKIISAPMVTESEIWIYGFDNFTPKDMLIIERLMKAARSVNIVMTYEEDNDIFKITGRVIKKLLEAAEDINEETKIGIIEKPERKTVWKHIGEQDLYEGIEAQAKLPITAAKLSDPYAEAERAAAFVLELVRDIGYRYGDILIICNDMDGIGSIVSRTFKRWGIPLFMDKKRTVMHHPAVGCLLAIMEIVSKGYKTASVMRMIKSGLMRFDDNEIDLLENYANEFKIKGNMWLADFVKTGNKYNSEEMARLNAIRESVVSVVSSAKDAIGRYNTAAEKTKGLYDFLDKDFGMRERIRTLIEKQEDAGFAEGAAETAQSWNVICSILDQIVEILGEEKISNEELLKLMTIGMEKVEIGLVPVSSDRVIMGSLQRTRISRIKALLVLGANNGMIPLESAEDGLISEREKEILEELDVPLSKSQEISRKEEHLAIYRMMHLPEELIYISCSETGADGRTQRPSIVFERLLDILNESGKASVLGDLGSTGNVADMLTCSEGTLSFMTEAIHAYADGAEIDEDWIDILNWYEDNRPKELQKVKKGMLFDNMEEAIGEEFSDALYRADRENLEVSASRLEKYSSCPFKHFIMYGLRAESPLVYEMGAREIGDIYHYCLMKLSERLTPDKALGIAVDDPSSPWMTITEPECREHIDDIIHNEMAGFREGLMDKGKAESYRTQRILDICCDAAWSMIKQIRKGRVKEMFFEQPFGNGKALPPIRVEAGKQEVLIKGIIDRMDILHEDAIRVIDYKTGSDVVDVDYMCGGYKLQLMVYMKAAMQNKAEPAGVFYFKIDDLDTDADKTATGGDKKDVERRLDESYKLVGIVLNDECCIEAMDSAFGNDGEDKSTVIPVKYAGKEKKLNSSTGGYLMEREEFDALMKEVDTQVKRICTELCRGEISIKPKKERKTGMNGNKTACDYCEYRSICMFDTSFKGCRFELI